MNIRGRRRALSASVLASRRGAAAVEYALVLPALLLFTFGAMDVGRLLWTQTTLERAAEAAARCGAIDAATCGTISDIKTYAVGQAYGLPLTAGAFTVTLPACGVQVVADSSFTFVIPWIGTPAILLRATACYPT